MIGFSLRTSSFSLLFLGVIAEYIGRIFEEVKHRPLCVVRERIGQSAGEDMVRGEKLSAS